MTADPARHLGGHEVVVGRPRGPRPAVAAGRDAVAPLSAVKSTSAITDASWISGCGFGRCTQTASSRWRNCCSDPGPRSSTCAMFELVARAARPEHRVAHARGTPGGAGSRRRRSATSPRRRSRAGSARRRTTRSASLTNFVSCSGWAPASSGSSSALNRASRSASSRSSTITAPSASSAAAMRSAGSDAGTRCRSVMPDSVLVASGSCPAPVRHDVGARPGAGRRPSRPLSVDPGGRRSTDNERIGGARHGTRSGDHGRHDRRRHRRGAVHGRRRHRRRAHHRGRGRLAGERTIDADGAVVAPGGSTSTRTTTARRRGTTSSTVVRQRRDHAGDGQLRRGLRAVPARRAVDAHRADGGRRGHPRQRPPARACRGARGRRSPSTSTSSARRQYALDIAAQLAHGSLRFHVMRERGVANEDATADDIADDARRWSPRRSPPARSGSPRRARSSIVRSAATPSPAPTRPTSSSRSWSTAWPTVAAECSRRSRRQSLGRPRAARRRAVQSGSRAADAGRASRTRPGKRSRSRPSTRRRSRGVARGARLRGRAERGRARTCTRRSRRARSGSSAVSPATTLHAPPVVPRRSPRLRSRSRPSACATPR